MQDEDRDRQWQYGVLQYTAATVNGPIVVATRNREVGLALALLPSLKVERVDATLFPTTERILKTWAFYTTNSESFWSHFGLVYLLTKKARRLL